VDIYYIFLVCCYMTTKTLNINKVIALRKAKNLRIEAVTKKIAKTNNMMTDDDVRSMCE